MKREELLVNAKPILFNTEMVKAILEDRKTVTRRVIKLDLGLADSDKNDSSCLFVQDKYGDSINVKDLCRYQVGDILYVRETFDEYTGGYCYKADWQGVVGKWKPSIHMPKEAARIFLKVKNVRVERLNELDGEEAVKEGMFDKYFCDGWYSFEPVKRFIDLWDSTIKEKDISTYGWYANPYVWVIDFEKINIEVAHNN